MENLKRNKIFDVVSFECPLGTKDIIRQYLHGSEKQTDFLNKAIVHELEKRMKDEDKKRQYEFNKSLMVSDDEELIDLRKKLNMDKYFPTQGQEIGLQVGVYNFDTDVFSGPYDNLQLSFVIDSKHIFEITVEPNEILPQGYVYIDLVKYPFMGMFLEDNKLGINLHADHLVRGKRCSLFRINIYKLIELKVEGSNVYKDEGYNLCMYYKECKGMSLDKRRKRADLEFNKN